MSRSARMRIPGDTVEEALGMMKDAIEGHLEVLEEDRQAKKSKRAS